MRKNYSKQRDEIKNAVMGCCTHPTAEEVYHMVKAMDSTASKSTVYRNLHELVAEGVLHKFKLPQGTIVFDGKIQEHGHVICKKCGKIFDVSVALHSDQLKVIEESGFALSSYQILCEGLCTECAKKDLS